MRKLGRFFKYLFRDIMDLSIAVTFIGLALIAGGTIYELVTAIAGLSAFAMLVAKVTVIAFTVALVCLVIEGEYRFIRALKNGTFRRSRKPVPIVNVYCNNCDGCDGRDEDDEPEDDEPEEETSTDEDDDPVDD